ncbi:mediator of RNA polymerase II transcription subunit 23-like isoform X3 [Haliotis rufescens]|uniref:mediator of RNA polymerase II transcription subunit 23-like isoform X3 n=1 Tax=Haliotis rufescens TaxID=6454 RepID=UPI001EAFFA06|nr:mediator of RNA polymerase II transcription subunit 23-like isoform X3 [Haliotis rufescens]
MSGNSVEERVTDVISDLLRSHAIEEAFCNIIVHSEETDAWNSKYSGEKLKKLWQTIPQESQDIGLRTFVDLLHRQCNASRVNLLCDLLESMVENCVVAPRSICEALLTREGLSYSQPLLWNATFKLIRKIIGGVDYKGVRDLLRVILDKLQNSLPSDNVAVQPEVEVVTDVVTYILDRNACLLPAYLAINEITKVCPDTSTWPQWSMGKMLSSFVDSFRPAAQMVSIAGRSHLLPVVGHSMSMNNVWRLNTTTLRFHLSGPLPYDKAIQDPQTNLLRYVLEQPYSREMVCNMLGLNKQAKQRCEVLEDQLVDLVVVAMERSESEGVNDDAGLSQLLWQHLSSQLIYFVLFQFASFPHMVMSLYEKLKGKNLKKGRDHLMWVLLQFISGSIQKNPTVASGGLLADFLPVMKLYDLLYSDDQLIPMPDVTKPRSTHALASTCIWIHLNKKAESDKQRLQRPIPYGLRTHLEFLKQTFNNNNNLTLSDYKIALLCNAYSTNTEFFSLPMGKLLESVYGNNKNTTLLPGNIVASAPTQPLSMSLLDSLTVHAKMSLIHSIVTRVIRLAKNKNNISLAPALVETYSRLLVYMEIESLGIKGFISQLLPTVFNSHALGILHTLLEMFSYRLHHTQIHYRIQLLGHLHTLATIQQTNQNQLHLCVESTALRLIISLGSYEVQPQLSRISNESKSNSFLAGESEELNRALVLTLARSVHITGLDSYSNNWCKEILMSIMQNTPLGWPSHTLQYFPPTLADYFNQNAVLKDDKNQLKRSVETEYKKWKSMVNENDLIAHFSMQGNAPLFLCIIFKSLLEDSRVSPTAYKVLDRLGPRALSAHLRAFADYLVFEFTTVSGNQNINRYMEALNEMIWRSNIVTIDRLVLCLILRNLEANEAQMRCLIVQLLLVHLPDFKNRVHDFVKDNTPEHWQQANWHEKHMAFHKKYPEKFYYEGIQDLNNPIHHQHLPVYFGNVCLRFLPVLDVTIHRLLEFQKVQKILESILDQIGCLYKFHDRPVTYLYNTLFYYEKRLSGKSSLKRKLVQGIIAGAFKEIRPPNWCLSEDYNRLLQMPHDDLSWIPDQDYYVRLIARLVDTIGGKIPPPFPNCDWRFNEFPNPAAHALHATCVELMALPVSSPIVGNALLDVALKSCFQLPRDKIMSWMNAVGLVLTALPEPFWVVLNDRIVDAFNSTQLTQSSYKYPFQMFNFHSSHIVFAEQQCSYLLGLCHAIWHHAGIGQLSQLPQFLKERLKPVIKTEEQYLYLCHLIGPFLQRFHVERTRCLLELTVELYEILMTVDKSCEHLNFMDPICDFLYHIKYMFIGDGVKHDVEKVIRNLRPALQLRLRFISHINVEEPVSA